MFDFERLEVTSQATVQRYGRSKPSSAFGQPEAQQTSNTPACACFSLLKYSRFSWWLFSDSPKSIVSDFSCFLPTFVMEPHPLLTLDPLNLAKSPLHHIAAGSLHYRGFWRCCSNSAWDSHCPREKPCCFQHFYHQKGPKKPNGILTQEMTQFQHMCSLRSQPLLKFELIWWKWWTLMESAALALPKSLEKMSNTLFMSIFRKDLWRGSIDNIRVPSLPVGRSLVQGEPQKHMLPVIRNAD